MILGITCCLFIGATGKSAQIPLFTWLPDAMAGPTPVSALIHAATMVTAGIFLVVRSNFLFELAPQTQSIILYIGLATSLSAAFMAMRQNDIKKVLAYSTVSQLGFIFVSLGMGGYVAAMFHVTTHAFFKALLFLGSGSVIHAMHHEQDIALLTAVYMFRLYFVVFQGEFRGDQHTKDQLHESPLSMTLPLIVLAVLSVIGGGLNLPSLFGGNHWLGHYLNHSVLGLNKVTPVHLKDGETIMLMVVASILAVAALLVTYMKYVKKASEVKAEEDLSGWEKLSARKLYVDELYEKIAVKPVERLATFLHDFFELKVLNRFIVLITQAVDFSAGVIRKWQTGVIAIYLFWMVSGILGLVIYYLIKF